MIHGVKSEQSGERREGERRGGGEGGRREDAGRGNRNYAVYTPSQRTKRTTTRPLAPSTVASYSPPNPNGSQQP